MSPSTFESTYRSEVAFDSTSSIPVFCFAIFPFHGPSFSYPSFYSPVIGWSGESWKKRAKFSDTLDDRERDSSKEEIESHLGRDRLANRIPLRLTTVPATRQTHTHMFQLPSWSIEIGFLPFSRCSCCRLSVKREKKEPTRLWLAFYSFNFGFYRITCFHLPFQSKWLYVGTERGNVHIVNIESFSLSGYVINWNKAIEL